MNIDPNTLKQWIDFYKSQMPNVAGGDRLNGVQNTAVYDAGAMDFAQQMAQGNQGPQMPDYFANVPNGNPLGGANGETGLGAGGMPPQQGYNRLAMMLRRGGR